MRLYSDIVPTYEEYLALQTGQYASHECLNPDYVRTQSAAVNYLFERFPRSAPILDIACGDGVGLCCLRDMGFLDITGFELNKEKAAKARELSGCKVIEGDMHDLSAFADRSFDAIFSSHSIEHAYYPAKMVDELWRVLRRGGRCCGQLFVILPFPDPDDGNIYAHGCKHELGTSNTEDGGQSVIDFFGERRFGLVNHEYHHEREPEIWLHLIKSVRRCRTTIGVLEVPPKEVI